jgi:serine/threonine protein kinase
MEYVDGPTLVDVFQPDNALHSTWSDRAHNDPFLLVRIARQVLWPLAYLHGQSFFHLDIASKNIFIRDVNSRPHIILGDVGVGRHLTADISDAQEIFISGTKLYTPPEVLQHLNTNIPVKLLRTYAPYWDIFAACKTLESLMAAFNLSGHPDLEATRLLVERLSSFNERLTAEDCAEELGRLLPERVQTAGCIELSSDASARITNISIPLYQVPISRRVRDLINHPMFARLQRIPQLSLVRSVFPGAVHTREEHSLGSYALGVRALTTLLSRARFRAIFSSDVLEEALLSVLLYNVTSFAVPAYFLRGIRTFSVRRGDR